MTGGNPVRAFTPVSLTELDREFRRFKQQVDSLFDRRPLPVAGGTPSGDAQ